MKKTEKKLFLPRWGNTEESRSKKSGEGEGGGEINYFLEEKNVFFPSSVSKGASGIRPVEHKGGDQQERKNIVGVSRQRHSRQKKQRG